MICWLVPVHYFMCSWMYTHHTHSERQTENPVDHLLHWEIVKTSPLSTSHRPTSPRCTEPSWNDWFYHTAMLLPCHQVQIHNINRYHKRSIFATFGTKTNLASFQHRHQNKPTKPNQTYLCSSSFTIDVAMLQVLFTATGDAGHFYWDCYEAQTSD